MRALSLFLVLGLVSCGSDNGSANAPDDGASAAKFSEIFDLIYPTQTNARCSFCHGLPANEISNGSLHMGSDAQTAYAALVGQSSVSKACGGKPLVVSGHPDDSLFLQKLSGSPPCGNRMPLGGAVLPDAQLQMIRGWITAGAKDD